ncbi:GFA family protein [Marinicaulis aureus]|uniref:GFA family protein n=1 Tax=Hyphococcus aureus TaxID=2666033 RepID=A0ABW1KRN2_9PROT
MPLTLKGGCRCGAVSFTVDTHTPVPYQRCYCSICRKTAGGGGYAINLGALNKTLKIKGKTHIGVYQAVIDRGGVCEKSSGERNFCKKCGTALWLYDPNWPDLVHPHASAIDSDLPKPPSLVHCLLKDKAAWVTPAIGRDDQTFDHYPDESIEDWHKSRGLWVD